MKFVAFDCVELDLDIYYLFPFNVYVIFRKINIQPKKKDS